MHFTYIILIDHPKHIFRDYTYTCMDSSDGVYLSLSITPPTGNIEKV